MSTDNSHLIIGPKEDMWGAMLTRYLAAVGIVTVQYDCLLTIKDEVRLVWPGPLNFPKCLYFINRYLPATMMIFCNYVVAPFRPAITTNVCRAWMLVSGISLMTSTTSATVLLTLRVAALYRGVGWVTRLLWLAFAIFQGLRVGILVFGDVTISQGIIYSPISSMCIVGSTSYRPTALIAIPAILDVLLLVLTILKAIRSPVSLKKNSIMYALIRDEILFFVVITSIRVFNAFVWFALSPALVGILWYAEWGLESAFVSRFFLNLRSITSHEVLTEALTQVPPSAIAWRRPFTEFKMDKGIFSSGPTPSEPDAQHAEEAMELQAHGH